MTTTSKCVLVEQLLQPVNGNDGYVRCVKTQLWQRKKEGKKIKWKKNDRCRWSGFAHRGNLAHRPPVTLWPELCTLRTQTYYLRPETNARPTSCGGGDGRRHWQRQQQHLAYTHGSSRIHNNNNILYFRSVFRYSNVFSAAVTEQDHHVDRCCPAVFSNRPPLNVMSIRLSVRRIVVLTR